MIKTLIIIAIVIGTLFLALIGYMAGFIRATRLFSYKDDKRTKFEQNLIDKLVKDDPNIDADFKSFYVKHEENIITDEYKKRVKYIQDLANGKLDELIKKENKIKPIKKRKSNAKRK